MPEWLAGMYVRQMHLDKRNGHSAQRIAKGDAGMRVSRRIDDDRPNPLFACRVDTLNQRTFVVTLESLEFHTGTLSQLGQGQIDVSQRGAAVMFGFARTEQVEIGPVHYQNTGLFDRPGSSFSLRHSCKFAANRCNLSSLFLQQRRQGRSTDSCPGPAIAVLHRNALHPLRHYNQIGIRHIGCNTQHSFDLVTA